MKQQFRTLAAAVMLTASALTAQNLTIGSTDSRLNLNLSGDQSKVGVALYDLAGRKLFEKSELLSAGTHGFDLPSSLARGMYIMQVDIDGKQFTRKFVSGGSVRFEVMNNSSAQNKFSSLIQSRSTTGGTMGSSINVLSGNVVSPRFIVLGDVTNDSIDDYAYVTDYQHLKIMRGNADGSVSQLNEIVIGGTNSGHVPGLTDTLAVQKGFVRTASGQSIAYLGKYGTETHFAALIQRPNAKIQPWFFKIDASGTVKAFNPIDTAYTDRSNVDNTIYNAQNAGEARHTSMISFDANKDGKLDLAISTLYSVDGATYATYYPGKLEITLFDQFGATTTKCTYSSPHRATDSPKIRRVSQAINRIGDLDKNGYEDLLIGGTIYYLSNTSGLSVKDTVSDLNKIFNAHTTDNASEYSEIGGLVPLKKDIDQNVNGNNPEFYRTYFNDWGDDQYRNPFSRIKAIGDIDGDGNYEFTFNHINGYRSDAKGRFIYVYTMKPNPQDSSALPVMTIFDKLYVDDGNLPDGIFAYGATGYPLHEILLSRGINGTPILTAASKMTASNGDITYDLWSTKYQRDRRTPEQKMLSFSAPELWTPEQQNVASMSYVAGGSATDKSLKVKFTNGTWLGLQGQAPVISLKGQSYQRVICRVKLAIPATRIATQYRGNFQIHSGWGWVGQFDINDRGANGVPYVADVNGIIHLSYEFQVPDNVRDGLLTGSPLPRFCLSAARVGEEFTLEGVEYLDGGEEKNVKPANYKGLFDPSNVVSWESYIASSDPLTFRGVVTHDIDGDRLQEYFILNQDVDYPMYLTQMWSKLPEYEPGGHTAFLGTYGLRAIWQCWRQCWTYIGKETDPLVTP